MKNKVHLDLVYFLSGMKSDPVFISQHWRKVSSVIMDTLTRVFHQSGRERGRRLLQCSKKSSGQQGQGGMTIIWYE